MSEKKIPQSPPAPYFIAPLRFVDIEYEDEYGKCRLIYGLNARTLFTLSVDQVAPCLAGRALADALERRGAVLHDPIDNAGRSVPAEQRFSRRTGRLYHIGHYEFGKLHDASDGSPAIRQFDEDSGTLYRSTHYRHGHAQNPTPDTPALCNFDPESGTVTDITHFDNGDVVNPTSGDPGMQEFDAHGRITAAHRVHGSSLIALTAKELAALNCTRADRAAARERHAAIRQAYDHLPASLRRFEFRGA